MEKKIKNKPLKYFLGILVLGFLLYFSIYFESLHEVKLKEQSIQFNAQTFVADFWSTKLLPNLNEAVEADILIELFRSNMSEAVNRFARTLGIASQHAYLIQGSGKIEEVNSLGLVISLISNQDKRVLIATSEIFGNAVRDASGLLDVSDFPSTMEFNTISVEINRIVKSRVIPPILDHAKEGKKCKFVGAAEVSEDDPQINPLRIIPIQISWDVP